MAYTQAELSGTIDKVDRLLFERYGDVQAFAFHPGARGTSEETEAAMNFFTRCYGLYDLMLVADLDGRIVACNSIDAKGAAIASRGLIGRSVAGEPWFEAIRSGKTINEGRRIAESTLTAIMGRMSAYTGRELSWDWAMNASKLDLTPGKYELGPLPVMPALPCASAPRRNRPPSIPIWPKITIRSPPLSRCFWG